MTDRQEEFYLLYMSGVRTGEIARRYGVNRSTVTRIISRAENHLRRAERLKRRVDAMQKEAGNDNISH